MKYRYMVIGMIVFFLSPVIASSADKVVVIPLGHALAKQKKKVLTIPPAAFRPENSSQSYCGDGSELYGSSNGWNFFVAPVYLPQGARVTKIKFYWKDCNSEPSGDGDVSLYQVEMAVGGGGVLSAESSGGTANNCNSGVSEGTGSVIIDNESYIYYLRASLPVNSNISGEDITLYAVSLEYM